MSSSVGLPSAQPTTQSAHTESLLLPSFILSSFPSFIRGPLLSRISVSQRTKELTRTPPSLGHQVGTPLSNITSLHVELRDLYPIRPFVSTTPTCNWISSTPSVLFLPHRSRQWARSIQEGGYPTRRSSATAASLPHLHEIFRSRCALLPTSCSSPA